MSDKSFIFQAWHELYLDFVADPADHRTVEQFAKDNQLDPSTVYYWKRQHKAEVAIEADRRRKMFVAELRNRAWKALDKKMGSDTKAIQLVFQLLGDLVEKSEVKHDMQTAEEKRQEVTRIMAEIRAKLDAKKHSEPVKPPENGTSQA